MRVHNRNVFYDRRKELRNNSTSQEIILWQNIKDSKLGCKFRRQHSIGPYIIDFYCPEKKIIVEVDGSQHGEGDAKEYDEERSQYLNELGLMVIRFWNNEVGTNLPAVLLKIRSYLGI